MLVHDRCALRALLVLGAVGSTGCMGIYVEGQATVYPSMKYQADSEPTKPEDKVVGGSGTAYGVGINVGVAFEGKRSSRFTMGYLPQTTSLPGGSSSGGITDFRYEGKIARLGSGKILRLGIGTGLSSATKGKMDKVAGGEAESRELSLSAYAGVSYAQYFGKHHEISVMGAGAFGKFGMEHGAYNGYGLGLKLAYTFMFGDTRPNTTFIVPLDTTSNLMPAIERGAKKNGCVTDYGEKRDETEGGGYGLVATYVDAKCGSDEIFFLERKGAMGILCTKMEEDDCRELMGKIVDAAKAEKKPEPPKSEPPKPEAPKPEAPRPTDPPKPEAPKAEEPKPTESAPIKQ